MSYSEPVRRADSIGRIDNIGRTERPGRVEHARDQIASRVRRRYGIKRFLPRTLFGRSLMIIVTPVTLMQLIAVFYFYQQHWETMTSRLSFAVAGELAMIVDLLEEIDTPGERTALFDMAAQRINLTITFDPGETMQPRDPIGGHWILQKEMNWALRNQLNVPFSVVPVVLDRWAEIQLQLPDGVMTVLVPRQRLFSITSILFVIWMVGSGVVLFAVALLFMRNQIRPIRRLAAAADSFGKGHDAPDFKPEGASEVRQAARAFLVMRDRIQRQIAQRTDMLAGVSHDLRTPLTRMKLQLAMLGDGPDIDELKADVTDMEMMIADYLAFARGEGEEQTVTLDLANLLEDVVASARREGAVINLDVPESRLVQMRPKAFKRCIANLLSNARRCADRVWVATHGRDDVIEITVDDDGPGIPDNRLEYVFKPFYRLDPSRNQETGGSGLGLTIARDIARAHGGDIRLSRAPHGGLRCTVSLPG